MGDFRPGKLTLGVKFCEDSDFEVENMRFLHQNLKFSKNEPLKVTVYILCFFFCVLFNPFKLQINQTGMSRAKARDMAVGGGEGPPKTSRIRNMC